MTALYYGAFVLWRRRTMAALLCRRCTIAARTMAAPYYGGAVLGRHGSYYVGAVLCRRYFDRVVLWRRCIMTALYYGAAVYGGGYYGDAVVRCTMAAAYSVLWRRRSMSARLL